MPEHSSILNFLAAPWRSVIPWRRKAISFVGILPLAVFLMLFGSACFLLEHCGVLLFTWPEAFWLSVLLPWFWWMHENGFSGLCGLRGLTALFLRLGIAGLFIVLLAEPRSVRKNTDMSVVYALDVSDSVSDEALGKSHEFMISTTRNKPAGDKAGLVVFGGNSAVELPPRPNFPLGTVNSVIEKGQTNIEKALLLSAAILPEDENARIVLISDGNETSGTARSVLEHLKSRSIEVDVLPLDFDFKHEVWLDKLDLPAFVKEGETYEAVVILSSLAEGRGTLVLTENGEQVFEQEVEYSPGKNRFGIPIYMRAPGYYEYAAKILVPNGKDGWSNNNVAMNFLYLKGKGKVLLLKDYTGDDRDWEPMARIIRDSGREVDPRDPFDCPADKLSMMQYDCIVMANVSADMFELSQLDSIRNAVFSQGAGLLMTGGKNSFGPGGYHRTPIEEALPVDMDVSQKKIMPAGSLVFVVDRSGSMASPVGGSDMTQQEIANKAVALASRTLLPGDNVGVVAFDTESKWIYPLQEMKNSEEFTSKIMGISPGGGTDIYPALAEAINALSTPEQEKFSIRHVILLSDGDTAGNNPLELIKHLSSRNISLSTVAIGDHANMKLLLSLAKFGGGSAHVVKNPQILPKIFVKEALTLRKNMIQNRTFIPEIEFDDGSILKGIDALPPVHGYVLTMPKSDSRRCTVILAVPEPEQVEPLLAVGRFGTGKSAAFTSDLSPNWCKDWMEWDRLDAFVSQLVVSISRAERERSLRISAHASGNKGVISVEDFSPHERFLDLSASISGPDKIVVELKLEQTASRRYQGRFELWGQGRYQIVVAGGDGSTSETVTGGLIIPYAPEYLKFQSNPILLEKIAESTGGRILHGDEKAKDIFVENRKTRSSSKPIFGLFLAILAFLIPLDVGVRRVQIDFSAILAPLLKTRAAQKSTETLGTLLSHKKSVMEQHRMQHIAARSIPPREAPTRHTDPQDRRELSHEKLTDEIDAVIHGTPPEESSTTGRLLAKKRGREKKTAD